MVDQFSLFLHLETKKIIRSDMIILRFRYSFDQLILVSRLVHTPHVCRVEFNEMRQKCDCRFRRRICVKFILELILSAEMFLVNVEYFGIWRAKILSDERLNFC